VTVGYPVVSVLVLVAVEARVVVEMLVVSMVAVAVLTTVTRLVDTAVLVVVAVLVAVCVTVTGWMLEVAKEVAVADVEDDVVEDVDEAPPSGGGAPCWDVAGT